MKKVEKRVYHNLEMYQVRIETEIHNILLGLYVISTFFTYDTD